MPPHGRRRLSGLLTFLASLFIFTSTACAASSAVLGIDLGTEYIKAALVKPGVPLDIVLTKDSKRKEHAAVAFKGFRPKVDVIQNDAFPERIYGSDAVALSARFPKDVYPNLKPLLASGYRSEVSQTYGSIHPELQMVEWPTTGTVGFKSDSFGEDEQPFMIEELLAMELKNIKGNAETMAGKGHSIEDAVITIPSFFTVEERRAVTTAAELAGLRILSLMSDGLAIGLNYATSRIFPTVNDGGKAETHLVYDMGAGSTTATVLKFQGRKVKDVGKFNKTIQEVQVLGTSWDKTLGGDALNALILDDIIGQFTQKAAIKAQGLTIQDVKAHGRTMAKLWKESERIRQVLSANSETSANFESLYYDDQNLKYKLSRNIFEKLAAGFLPKVQQPLVDALESAKLTIADLDSVILHGGAVRTPFVQKQLESLVKDPDKIRTNVNSDEAAVFGAGFKAAAISPSFRVKEIRTSDSAVYPVVASYKVEGKDKQQKIFVPTSAVGAEKQVTFKATTDFEFDLSQSIETQASALHISRIKTRNLTDSVKGLTIKAGCASSDINTKFTIRLSPIDGLPEVFDGSVSCEATEGEKKGVVDGMKDFLGFGSRKEDQKPFGADNEDDSLSSTSVTDSSSSITASETKTSSAGMGEPTLKVGGTIKDAKGKTRTVHIDFVTESTGSSKINSKDLSRIQKRLTAFDASDRSRVLREETLNTLEAYTYKIRDTLKEEGFIAASTSAQRDEIEAKSNDASVWLYGDGADAPRDVLKEKLDELRNLVKPITQRKEESIKRPEALKQLQDGIRQAETMVSVIKQQQEAQSTADAASSSTSTSISDSTTTPPPSSSDEFAELDDDPAVSSSTTAIIPETPKSIYNKEDLNAVTEKQASIQKWLDETLAAQEKLALTDDPVLLSSELTAKAKEINEMVTSLIMKQMNVQRPKKANASTKTSKNKSKNSKTGDADSNASAPSEANPSSTIEAESDPSPEQSAETGSKAETGGWTQGPPDPEPEQGLPTVEEHIEMARKQQQIDEELAAEKSSVKAKTKASATKKEKKVKSSTKAKSKGKGKAKAKGKDKKKAEEREL